MGMAAYYPSMLFNQKLEQLIDRKGWKPPTLWERLRRDGLKVGRTTVYRWVNGERDPNIKALRSLARVLEVSLDVLAFDDIDLPPADSSQAELEAWIRQTIKRIGPEEAQRRLLFFQLGPYPEGLQYSRGTEDLQSGRAPDQKHA
jgi:transcriptional regulator with XRE-family HTH domain